MYDMVDELPVLVIALLLVVVGAMAMLAGRTARRQLGASAGETLYATTATISLFTLLVGFTFSVALNRYDTRRDLVVEETAGCFALWQRLQLQPAPYRAEMAATMRAYVDARLAWANRGRETDRDRPGDTASDALMERMWNLSRAAGGDGARLRLMADSLSRVDDAAWRREAMAREHIPLPVIDALLLFLLLSAVSLGYSGTGDGRLARLPHLLFLGLATGAVMLVLDLDRPRSGLVTVNQAPMRELSGFMARDMATDQTLRP
jgi:hypothetical protein